MQEIFQKIPKASLEYVKGLINCENILFKLKNNRETKHGDFSVKKDFSVEITINSDMNPFRFLITLLHEISHFLFTRISDLTLSLMVINGKASSKSC